MDEMKASSVQPSIDQVGIVTRDLHSMVAGFEQLLGVTGFRIMEWPIEGVDPQATYHGDPSNYRLLLAFATIGQTQIEIIEPLEGQNIYSDFLETHGPGLHHIRYTVPDFEERVVALEASGIKNIASGNGVHVGSRFAYFDTSTVLGGVIIELRKYLDSASGQGQWIDNGQLDEEGKGGH